MKKEIDLTNDGQTDKTEVYTVIDANGRALETVYYTGETATSRNIYVRNENGWITKTSRDMYNDGSIQNTTTYEHDELGRVSKEYYDTDNDGVIDRSVTYTRDNNGYVTKAETDFGNNGVIDSVITYQRDALGRVALEERDNNNDGMIDIRYEQTRDAYNNIIESKNYTLNSSTGTLTLNTDNKYTYNEIGQQTLLEEYNALTNVTNTRVRTYNEFGLVMTEEYGTGARWVYSYNDLGQVYSRIDYNAQGQQTLKSIFTEYYNEFGSNGASKIVESYNSNDVLTSISEYIRDNSGIIIHTLTDNRSNTNGVGVDQYIFGDRGANTTYNVTEDMTQWSEQELEKLGDSLSRIRFSNGSVSSLTISAEVVAKISNGGLRIETGSDNNDILNLIGFEKSENSSRRGFDQYTAEVNGEHLDLFVSTTVDTTIIG